MGGILSPACGLTDLSRTPSWMPSISEFFGIVIYMNFEDHAKPHFHAKYAEFEAAVEIKTRQITGGRLPPRIHRLARKWAALHEEELTENWDVARERMPLKPIAPLY